MVGFEEIDRKFRPPAKLELECTFEPEPGIVCGKTGPDVFLRRSLLRDVDAVLCERCWQKWC